MAASTVYCFPPLLASLSSFADKHPHPLHSLRFKFSLPLSPLKLNPPSIRVFRSEFSGAAVVAQWAFRVRGLVGDDSVPSPQPESGNSQAGRIDLNLPRRSLLVQFTCDLCGERTKKLVNRLAYERGVIFVQCAGCRQHHKLVDNLGLITEYDFREKMNMDSEIDQV